MFVRFISIHDTPTCARVNAQKMVQCRKQKQKSPPARHYRSAGG
jgi:hypothetical protein